MLAAVTGAPFDLAAGPALRADLLRLGVEDHLLALTFHHLVFDGWSVSVLLRELAALLRRSHGRQHPRPPDAPHPVRRLRGLAARPGAEARPDRQVAFWTDRLRGVPALQLPADGPPPEHRSRPGRGVPFELPEAVTQGILRLSQERGTTPFATLLAGFQALISRHAGQHDLAVAVPVAGRTRSETEDLIGFFVNTRGGPRRPRRQPALRRPPGPDAGQPARGAHQPGGAVRADRRSAPAGS